jgi:hypothetical protein
MNRSISLYNTMSTRRSCISECGPGSPWQGYGVNYLTVDNDSYYKYDPRSITHGKCRQQLPNRLFHAVPSLYRGTVLPGLEARISHGTDTSFVKNCSVPLSEMRYDTFNPMISPDFNTVEKNKRGGESSRDIAKSDEFLHSIGYYYDGKVWRR